MESEKLVCVDLVPVNEYMEGVNEDGSKRFTCLRCNSNFKQKHGVKQHYIHVHAKNGEAPYKQAIIPESKAKKS